MKKTLLSVVLCACTAFPCAAQFAREEINLGHLEWLTKVQDGLGLVAVYAERDIKTGEYRHVFAKGAGNKGKELEGVACVDDVARAAVLLLRYYRITGDVAILERVKPYLEFLLRMQEKDGTFYNFVYADLSVNKKGRTSRKSVDWWMGRAIWALGSAFAVFQERDPALARRLGAALDKTLPRLEPFLKKRGQYREAKLAGRAVRVPLWLIGDSGGLTAVVLLGITRYHEAAPSPKTRELIMALGEGLAAFQYGDFNHPPFGAHMSWAQEPELWHGWGNRQVHALAYAGKVVGRKDFIESAVQEAEQWLSHLAVVQIPYKIAWGGESRAFERIPYAQSCAVMDLHALGLATGEERYHTLAGLLASWFYGNNSTGEPMYDPATGRGYDGISLKEGLPRRNMNSGGEATIETLLAVLDAASHPASLRAMRMSRYHRPEIVTSEGKKREPALGELLMPAGPMKESVLRESRLFENPASGEKIELIRDYLKETVRIRELP
ncbi:MAG: hypothetical protein ABIJ96_09705 [Elusimicrobiota bacterium]